MLKLQTNVSLVSEDCWFAVQHSRRIWGKSRSYLNITCLRQGLSYSDWQSSSSGQVQSGGVLTGLLVRKSYFSFAELKMDKTRSTRFTNNSLKTVHLNFIHHCLGGVSINFSNIFQFNDSWKVNLILIDKQSLQAHTKIQLVSFVVQGLFCSIKFVRIYEQGNKALINWAEGIYYPYLFHNDLLHSVGHYGKGRWQYNPALTSHSVRV